MFLDWRKSQMIQWPADTSECKPPACGKCGSQGDRRLISPRSLRCWHLPGSADGFQGTHLSLSLARIGHKCRVVYSPLQGFPFSLSALRGCRVLPSPCLCCSEHEMLKPEKVMDVPSLWSNLNSAQNVSFELALFILLIKNQSQMKGKTLK